MVNKRIQGIKKEIAQHAQGRYSSKLGGFIFDALLAHFSVAVSSTLSARDNRVYHVEEIARFGGLYKG